MQNQNRHEAESRFALGLAFGAIGSLTGSLIGQLTDAVIWWQYPQDLATRVFIYIGIVGVLSITLLLLGICLYGTWRHQQQQQPPASVQELQKSTYTRVSTDYPGYIGHR